MMFDGGNICNTCDRTTDDAADDSRPTHQQNPQCGSSAGGNGVPLEDVPPPQDSTTISETFGYDEDHMALLDLQLDRYRYLLLQNREELQQARQTNDDLHSQLDIYEGMLTAYECTIVDLQSRVNLEVLTEDTNCPQLAEAGDSCLVTVVLHEPCKPMSSVAKSFRPMLLLNNMTKVVRHDLSRSKQPSRSLSGSQATQLHIVVMLLQLVPAGA
ncbi:hypothetical protein CCHR01_19499 [Colletotrichum chrysophilum]|uniref:Uncharacterized protein n=1 Tax=Colletotrichum chrysophilum TaxID=1836956 RepID=A0AAD8ZY61_9PEZI|nr:hypothetical protein CCHR01_19499 [Colletotrichum chrysophilum]